MLRSLPEHALFATDADRARALEQLNAEPHAGRGLGRAETLLILASLMLLGAVLQGVAVLLPGAHAAPPRTLEPPAHNMPSV